MTIQPAFETKIEELLVSVYETNEEMGRAAAEEAAEVIRQAVAEKGTANVIFATGNSQLTFLAALRERPEIEWSKVNVFHMDEYVGIDPQHPASFPNFLQRHLLDYVKPRAFYPVRAPAENTEAACREYEELLRAHPADLCAMGIGENGHIMTRPLPTSTTPFGSRWSGSMNDRAYSRSVRATLAAWRRCPPTP